MSSEQLVCIRCDEPTAEDYPDGGEDYHVLTLRQEPAGLVLCDDCFQEVGPVPSGSEDTAGETLNKEILFIMLWVGAFIVLMLYTILRYAP